MSILRSMTGKSGGSVTRISIRLSAVLAVSTGILALAGCSAGDLAARLSSVEAPDLDNPFRKQGPQAVTAIDRRVWRVNDADRFSGFVMADEPQAVIVGRDILASGGNAADAAVSVYFALAVTYPGAAGLGGGGSCLYHSADGGGVEQIDFPVRNAQGGGKVGIPGNIRGFTWLSVRHGRMNWDKLVDPAARLAGAGAKMSKATTAQMEANRSLRWPPQGMTSNGEIISLGRTYRQPGLAVTLGLIQGAGAGAFYNGELGRTFVSEARRSDSTVTQEDLRGYKVVTSSAARAGTGNKTVFTRNGTEAENSVWQSAIDGSKPITSDMNSLRSGDAGSTSFVVADGDGHAVACVVSMNGAFGFGDVSRTTGIYFSSAQDATSLSNIVMVKASGKGLIYAAASGGGASGLQKSAATFSEVALTKINTLDGALRQNQSSGFDPVNAFSCPAGLTKDASSCRFGSEPNSNGYALLAE